jgi:hypothetical protein
MSQVPLLQVACLKIRRFIKVDIPVVNGEAFLGLVTE